MSPEAAIQLFKLLMTDVAADWLEAVPDDEKNDLSKLKSNFRERFEASDIFRWKQAASVWSRLQAKDEPVDTYITDVLNLAKKVPIKDETLIRFALIKGFLPNIKQHVLQSKAANLEDVKSAARVAEAAATQVPAETTDITSLSKDVKDLISAVNEMKIARRATTPERVEVVRRDRPYPVPENPPEPQQQRRVTFSSPPARSNRYERPQQMAPPLDWSTDGLEWTPPEYRRQAPQPQPPWQRRESSTSMGRQPSDRRCGNCGRTHPPRRCPAYNANCYLCSCPGHFQVMCRSGRNSTFPPTSGNRSNMYRE